MNETELNTDDTMDERMIGVDEVFIPPWVVMRAVGRAIGGDVKGVERRGEKFAVLVERGDDE